VIELGTTFDARGAAMSQLSDDVRPLICPQVQRSRRRSGVAQVIQLHPRRHSVQVLRAVGASLGAIAAAILITLMLAICLRTARDVTGRFTPALPWW
jgi:hypothetical protein